jgi:hypothetical protein
MMASSRAVSDWAFYEEIMLWLGVTSPSSICNNMGAGEFIGPRVGGGVGIGVFVGVGGRIGLGVGSGVAVGSAPIVA